MATTEDRAHAEPALGWPGTGSVVIRAATSEDVEAVAAIEAASFPNPWRPETFRSLIEEGRGYVPVAEDSREGVVGYAVFWWVMEQGELANLAVREEHQGRGLGSALLQKVLDHARGQGVESVFLEVRISNETAHRLYLSRGFTQVALRKDYYQNPREDARILLKRLGDGEGEGEGKG